MKKFLRSLFRKEDGAVSVDWIVLTAAVVGLAAAGAATTFEGAIGASDSVTSTLSNMPVN